MARKNQRKAKASEKPTNGRIYIAGPMSGYPDYNFATFNEAAKRLRAAGYEVVNPAEMDGGDTSQSWGYYLKRDLPQLLSCDAVALLPGWERSRGAKLEVQTAKAVGMPVYIYKVVLSSDGGGSVVGLALFDETILEEAGRLTSGDRNRDYGHPLDDFGRSAAMWSAILGAPVTPEQVGLCMIAVKLARQCHSPKRDNLVDAAGYARAVEMIGDERQRRICRQELRSTPIEIKP